MTFRTEAGRIAGLVVQGHSGYAEAGADLVCAAITSAVRLTEATINDVLGLRAPVAVREAEIAFQLPARLSQEAEHTCQALLAGLMVYFDQLRQEYPENLLVLEEEA